LQSSNQSNPKIPFQDGQANTHMVVFQDGEGDTHMAFQDGEGNTHMVTIAFMRHYIAYNILL
jgi:hypothetical protein